MFIGREKELKTLENLYSKDGIGMTIIYGRRRIGKSTLIAEFIKNKKAIFYTATKVGKERNIELFARQVVATLLPALDSIKFESLESIFDFINKTIGKEKLILVIDELPYWAEKDDALLSILQKYVDSIWNDKNLKIILCGSSLSFMDNKVLSEKSPIFGRRESQIKLEAFDYLESAKFVPNYSYEDKAICYGITGGVAKYLSLINQNKSIDENIIENEFYLCICTKDGENAIDNLLKRANNWKQRFKNCDYETEILNKSDIILMIKSFTIPEFARKEGTDYRDNIVRIGRKFARVQ